MIVERLVFRAKFGQGDMVTQAFGAFRDRFADRFEMDSSSMRLLVDHTGPMFTVVIETQYRDEAHMARARQQEEQWYADPEFQQWFATWSQAVEHGHREIYPVVE